MHYYVIISPPLNWEFQGLWEPDEKLFSFTEGFISLPFKSSMDFMFKMVIT